MRRRADVVPYEVLASVEMVLTSSTVLQGKSLGVYFYDYLSWYPLQALRYQEL